MGLISCNWSWVRQVSTLAYISAVFSFLSTADSCAMVSGTGWTVVGDTWQAAYDLAMSIGLS